MENNTNFNQLWNEQPIAQPNLQLFKEQLKQYGKKNTTKIIFANVILLLTTAFILTIWYFAKPQLISTKLGIVITILAMAIFIIAYNKQIPQFSKLNELISNKSYLNDLLLLQKKQKNLHSKVTSLYFIMLSLGISLYMFEYVKRMTLTWGILSYAIVLFWILLNWFYFRPKTINKQQRKLNELIEHCNNLEQQLS